MRINVNRVASERKIVYQCYMPYTRDRDSNNYTLEQFKTVYSDGTVIREFRRDQAREYKLNISPEQSFEEDKAKLPEWCFVTSMPTTQYVEQHQQSDSFDKYINRAKEILLFRVLDGTIRNADWGDAKSALSKAIDLDSDLSFGEVRRHEPTFSTGVHNYRKFHNQQIKNPTAWQLERFEKLAPLCEQVMALRDKIVKGRKPSENSGPEKTPEGSATCGICNRLVKLTIGNKIYAHGYQIPWLREGDGSREGSCFGTGYDPIELSSKVWTASVEAAELRLVSLPKLISDLEAWLAAHPAPSASSILTPVERRERQERVERYDNLRSFKSELKSIPAYIEHRKNQIASWTLKPLPFGEKKRLV